MIAVPSIAWGWSTIRTADHNSCSERLAEAGIKTSDYRVGASYDNALVESINGLFKVEVIHPRGPWRSHEAVKYATLKWVNGFNNRRLLELTGIIPPTEANAY